MTITLRQYLHRNFYLRTPYWKRIRTMVMERALHQCEVVGCMKYGFNLDCHHTVYWIKWLEWLFPWKMVYLCRRHHKATHRGRELELRRGVKLKPFGRKH